MVRIYNKRYVGFLLTPGLKATPFFSNAQLSIVGKQVLSDRRRLA
ncbi:MAG TPA: hypothetical protein PLA96_06705 [Candidatus Brocadia sapporoensis]|nr:hypothetical protein [Candidatus Brocadia sapporoensis]HQU31174.1 hypothetical protein [Candidatus Brocadia sapporoensis]